jgi:hypothetical protein
MRRLGLCLATAGSVVAAAALVVAPGRSAAAQEHDHHSPAPSGTGDFADMGPHMRVTVKQPERAGDGERADRVVAQTRGVMEKYKDYHRALEDGYQPFLPQVPLPEYHFTNYRYGFQAAFAFDPERPTSLLYVREGDGYHLTGVMFTAAAAASLDELDRRLPLSVAQWHLHTSVCLPPPGRGIEMLQKNARFGFDGSIATAAECDAAGGRFFPHLFGWMVHVYPYEKDPASVFRMPGHHGHHGEAQAPAAHEH